jgi:hypothetical protein
MKKTVFVCPKDGFIEVNKVTSKDSIVREKDCPTCKGKMNFIRRNKKKYKNLLKKAG